MSSFYIRKDGQIQKPSDLICCKYRGAGVDCSKTDYADGKCKNCGWNPLVESKRRSKIPKRIRKTLTRWGTVCYDEKDSL